MTTSRPSGRAPTPTTVIVMGVSGSGKSTVAAALAEATGARLAEGDDFHPDANVEKMRSGQPLDDDDRWSWLRSIADWIGVQEQGGHDSVVTCSALRRSYRDLLREGHPSVRFCQLDASTTTLQARLEGRRGHYMPDALLPSQLETLQPLEDDEPGGRVSGEGDLPTVLRRVLHVLARADTATSAAERSGATTSG